MADPSSSCGIHSEYVWGCWSCAIAALDWYGDHTEDCARIHTGKDCDCGWDAVKTANERSL